MHNTLRPWNVRRNNWTHEALTSCVQLSSRSSCSIILTFAHSPIRSTFSTETGTNWQMSKNRKRSSLHCKHFRCHEIEIKKCQAMLCGSVLNPAHCTTKAFSLSLTHTLPMSTHTLPMPNTQCTLSLTPLSLAYLRPMNNKWNEMKWSLPLPLPLLLELWKM
jgi:hypothetical protein